MQEPYFWLDPQITNPENQTLLAYLKRSLPTPIHEFSTPVGCFYGLKSLEPPKDSIKLICAASLNDESYELFQEHERVRAICLYCRKEERAKELMGKFKKIRHFVTDPIVLRNLLMNWVVEG